MVLTTVEKILIEGGKRGIERARDSMTAILVLAFSRGQPRYEVCLDGWLVLSVTGLASAEWPVSCLPRSEHAALTPNANFR